MAATESSDQRISRIASLLVGAHRSGQAVTANPDTGPVTAGEAFAVQEAVWTAVAGAPRPTAWKVGAPTRTAEPIAGVVFPRNLQPSPAHFGRDCFQAFGAE